MLSGATIPKYIQCLESAAFFPSPLPVDTLSPLDYLCIYESHVVARNEQTLHQ